MPAENPTHRAGLPVVTIRWREPRAEPAHIFANRVVQGDLSYWLYVTDPNGETENDVLVAVAAIDATASIECPQGFA